MQPESKRFAVITGASSGIGAEYARQLAAKGYHLALVARREQRLSSLANKLNQDHGVECRVIAADLSTSEGIAALETYLANLETLDILVNNAGFGKPGKFHALDAQKIDEMLQLHIVATVRLSRAALTGMISRGGGAIINVASVAAFLPPRSLMYGTTKAYLVAFSKGLQYELKGTGVLIQAVCPGLTKTEFHETTEFTRLKYPLLPRFLWLEADRVVADSLEDLRKKKVISISGWFYRLLVLLGRNAFIAWIIRLVYSNR